MLLIFCWKNYQSYLSLVAAKSIYSSTFGILNTTSNSPLSERKNLCDRHSFAKSNFLVFGSLKLNALLFTYNLVLYEHVFMSNEDSRVPLSEKSSCRLNTLSRLWLSVMLPKMSSLFCWLKHLKKRKCRNVKSNWLHCAWTAKGWFL